MARRRRGLPPAAWKKWEELGRPHQFKWRDQIVTPLEYMFDAENQDKPAAQVAETEETKLQKLQDKALKLWNKYRTTAHELGGTLVAIKKMMGHGEFTKWWMEKKLKQNRVSYCMRLAEGKVAEAKEKLKRSPRTKALLTITKKLRKLYDLAESGDEEKLKAAKALLDEIDREIRERFFEKPKALAQHA